MARAESDGQDGYTLLTREMAVYKDPETGEILKTYHNPFHGRDVEVVPVWNDPVNSRFPSQFDPPREQLGAQTCFFADVLLHYPSPLPDSEYPLHSGSQNYQGAELFQFFADRDQLEDEQTDSVDCALSWTRLGPWLPWMEMGDHSGQLLYQARGHKLEAGIDQLPPELLSLVEQEHPEFLVAPESFRRPNETSWTYFKKKLNTPNPEGEPGQPEKSGSSSSPSWKPSLERWPRDQLRCGE